MVIIIDGAYGIIEIIFIISANGVNDKVNLVPVGIINAALIS